MLYEVTRLYEKGVKLERDAVAAAPKHVGNLTVRDWGDDKNAHKRNLRYADLKSVGVSGFPPRSLMARLMEPVLIFMGDRQFMLEGFEIDASGGAPVHYVQTWLISLPRVDESAPAATNPTPVPA